MPIALRYSALSTSCLKDMGAMSIEDTRQSLRHTYFVNESRPFAAAVDLLFFASILKAQL